jgi:bifunctional UDP-N-acetylglucosamine pyrophosphorylase/glucosamine-1-phosphate N-acetyltransferase
MKAIILAAGEGVRMQPLTLTTPKPLLKIADRPILDYIFKAFPKDIDEVIIVVKYLKEQIINFIGNTYCGKKVKYVEGSDLGSGYSFLATKDLINKERFLFVYGDEFPNKTDIRNCLKEDLSILVFTPKNPKANGLVKLRSDGTIEQIIEKPDNPFSDYAADGVMVLNSDIFKYQPTFNGKEYYLTTMVNEFISEHSVKAVKSHDFIGDISTPADLLRVEKIICQTTQR